MWQDNLLQCLLRWSKKSLLGTTYLCIFTLQRKSMHLLQHNQYQWKGVQRLLVLSPSKTWGEPIHSVLAIPASEELCRRNLCKLRLNNEYGYQERTGPLSTELCQRNLFITSWFFIIHNWKKKKKKNRKTIFFTQTEKIFNNWIWIFSFSFLLLLLLLLVVKISLLNNEITYLLIGLQKNIQSTKYHHKKSYLNKEVSSIRFSVLVELLP